MIYFTTDEIWQSLLISAFYGILFATASGLFVSLKCTVFDVCDCLKQITIYKKLTNKVVFKQNSLVYSKSAAEIFLYIVAFFLGYVLTCYVSLDGVLRVYVLVIALISYFVFKKIFIDKIILIFRLIFRVLLSIFTIIIRIIAHPLRRIYPKTVLKIVEKHCKCIK